MTMPQNSHREGNLSRCRWVFDKFIHEVYLQLRQVQELILSRRTDNCGGFGAESNTTRRRLWLGQGMSWFSERRVISHSLKSQA